MRKNPKVAMIAALEREVRPLVRGWQVTEREHQGRRFKVFENERAVLVCGGIGPDAARRAAEAVITSYDPVTVLSVGFAGALDPGLKAGAVFAPRTVVDIGDGSRIETGAGNGVLASFAAIADAEQKAKLAKAYGAQAVDMEAAAVGRAAQAHGVPFAALKAISDESDFVMPPLKAFVGEAGQFHPAKLAVFAAFRPWLWLSLIRLARNSSRAAKALCAALNRYNRPGEMSATPELQSAVGRER